MIYWEEIKQKKRLKGTSQVLDRPSELSEATGPSIARRTIPVEDVPRTTLAGLEATSPELHRDRVIELRGVRVWTPESLNQNSFQSLKRPGLLRIHLNLMDQERQLLASSMSRTAQDKRPPPQPPSSSSGSQNVALAGCDVLI